MSVFDDFLLRFRWKIDDFGGPERPCAGLGQSPESGVKKTRFRDETSYHFGSFFRVCRAFLTLDFSFIFEVTSESELSALWRRKGAQKEVFGKPFRKDFEVSGESENEAPVWTPAPVSWF